MDDVQNHLTLRTFLVRFPFEQGARGRNGWFTPHEVSVFCMQRDMQPAVCVDIHGRRPASTAPIVLYLAPNDAIALGKVLVEQGEALMPDEEVPCPTPVA